MNSPGKAEAADQQARDKNIEEYNKAADAYDKWQGDNILMQRYCYYSCFQELVNEGIEGKTFLEVGCGPCPIGRKLAAKGAKKIYGLDISEGMLEAGRKELTELGIIDKFELICADIFDTEKFKLPEQVDCVVISYAFTTFINNFDMLKKLLQQCKKQTKEDVGCCLIADFSYVKMPMDNFWAGMYTTTEEDNTPPGDFETFNFIID